MARTCGTPYRRGKRRGLFLTSSFDRPQGNLKKVEGILRPGWGRRLAYREKFSFPNKRWYFWTAWLTACLL